MKKILFFICLILLISCSSDNDSDNKKAVLTPILKSIETWKLISIKDESGNEIANDCELQNGRIVVNDDQTIADPFQQTIATITEGKLEGQECHIVTTTNIHWYDFMGLLQCTFPNNGYIFDYNCTRSYDNDHNVYKTITLSRYYGDIGAYYFGEYQKTYKYILESTVYPE
ncbi:hypothetical protein FLJC2902T_20720 [Flavobacterium limnosediminis JC2902]|uniref:Lipocalin-like domain-containing protein n=1 Tax=Flavobacterium limnosediminis JC2902 TaxID=1341181 RepID=V6SMA6_9FLAO|nr:hypothetical protein [Flavobacterium limnosediminis]ESU27367.1 hypothetical protein FLJC2902T_20720 [Flavobacterium limnosediminis JC2902]